MDDAPDHLDGVGRRVRQAAATLLQKPVHKRSLCESKAAAETYVQVPTKVRDDVRKLGITDAIYEQVVIVLRTRPALSQSCSADDIDFIFCIVPAVVCRVRGSHMMSTRP